MRTSHLKVISLLLFTHMFSGCELDSPPIDDRVFCGGGDVKGLLGESLETVVPGDSVQTGIFNARSCPKSHPYCVSTSQGIACSPCEQGKLVCNSSCVDVLTSSEHCGRCNSPCDGICVSGECLKTNCDATQTRCEVMDDNAKRIVCIDPKSKDSCGATCDNLKGTKCGEDFVCANGNCICDLGLALCEGHCIDPQTDNNYCGAGADCESMRGQKCDINNGVSCKNGVCACAENMVLCNGTCIDPNTDNQFCGAKDGCDTDETRGQTCDTENSIACRDGVCQCPEDSVYCGGKCIDPKTDNEYCGASADCLNENRGTVCNEGEMTCQNGRCVCNDSALTNCNGHCINAQVNGQFCGGKLDCEGDNAGSLCARQNGYDCIEGKCRCPENTVECNGKCIDPMTDNTYCGAKNGCIGFENCLQSNSKKCINGSCANAYISDGQYCAMNAFYLNNECVCKPGTARCNGSTCVENDNEHCGATGNCSTGYDMQNYQGIKCADNQICLNGVCTINEALGGKCGNNQIDCGDKGCLDPRHHIVNKACVSGEYECEKDYCDADGNPANGCEVRLGTNKHCTACGVGCGTDASCDNSGDVPKCTCNYKMSGYEMCGINCVSILTDKNNCGECGYRCGSEQVCRNDKCTPCDSSQLYCNGKCFEKYDSTLKIEGCNDNVIKCMTDYADCNLSDFDGCESNLKTDGMHCGECDNTCKDGMMCNDGSCCLPTGSTVKLRLDYFLEAEKIDAIVREYINQCCVTGELLCQKDTIEYPGYDDQIITLTCRETCPQEYHQVK